MAIRDSLSRSFPQHFTHLQILSPRDLVVPYYFWMEVCSFLGSMSLHTQVKARILQLLDTASTETSLSCESLLREQTTGPPPRQNPRGSQEVPKRTREAPKRAQEAPQRFPRGPKRRPRGPKRHPRWPKRHPREPKRAQEANSAPSPTPPVNFRKLPLSFQ